MAGYKRVSAAAPPEANCEEQNEKDVAVAGDFIIWNTRLARSSMIRHKTYDRLIQMVGLKTLRQELNSGKMSCHDVGATW